MKKRFLALSLAVIMAFSVLCTNAFAADDTTSIMVDQNDALIPPECHTTSGASTFAWGGTPAQVTKIELYNYGWLKENGNFGVTLKVTGYGNDIGSVFFNGNPISSKRIDYFINYGNAADGFYYLYDCGPITSIGTYDFTTTFTSTAPPYSKMSFSERFTFSAATDS